MISKEEAILEMCEIMALVYHSKADYSDPSDGFCSKCPASTNELWNFRNDGHVIAYIRNAVLEKLKLDGIQICSGFNSITGKPSPHGDEQQ